jgi:hypothetical protein
VLSRHGRSFLSLCHSSVWIAGVLIEHPVYESGLWFSLVARLVRATSYAMDGNSNFGAADRSYLILFGLGPARTLVE